MSKLIVAFIPLLFGMLALALLTDFSVEDILRSIQVIDPLDWHAIGTALFCGTLIGWERMLRNKVLGIRTSIFIILGVYVLTVVSTTVSGQHGFSEVSGAIADPTRGMSAIITGIGFLGAGVMFTKGDTVKGLTSAATIWMLAAMGITIGAGYLTTAIIVTTVGVVLLITINELDSYLIAFSKSIEKSSVFTVKVTVPAIPKYRVKRTMSGVPGYLNDDFYIQVKGKFLWRRLNDTVYDSYEDATEALNILEARAESQHRAANLIARAAKV